MPHRHHRIALAASALLIAVAASPTRAAVTVTGPWWSNPGGLGPVLNGPHLLLPQTQFAVGVGGGGTFNADAGSQVQLASFSMGIGATGLGWLDGAGTVMSLHGEGPAHRFAVGWDGHGRLVISGGAQLDGRANAAACQLPGAWCGSWIGHAAGSSGLLGVSGAGSEARFLGSFNMGYLAIDSYGGAPGGQTFADVVVEHGGLLRTQTLYAGSSYQGPGSNGLERSFVDVKVLGAGSRWLVEADTVTGQPTLAEFASGRLSTAKLLVEDGGRFEVVGEPGRDYALRLGFAGNFSGLVTGSGSALLLSGDDDRGSFDLGMGGSADLTVSQGGRIAGGRVVHVGHGGWNSQAGDVTTLTLTDAGSRGDFSGAALYVGVATVGRVFVTDGAVLTAEHLDTALGSDGNASLVVRGAGAQLKLERTSGPRFTLGSWGEGQLTVDQGGTFDARSAACNPGAWCGAFLGDGAGSSAFITVSGAGSSAHFHSSLVTGQLKVTTQAVDGYVVGTPGGHSRAGVTVSDAGLLVVERVDLGGRFLGSGLLGSETSRSDLVITGAGSLFKITGNAAENKHAYLQTTLAANSLAFMDIADGGRLLLEAPTGFAANLVLSDGQGRSQAGVHGTGSAIELRSTTGGWLYMGAGSGVATLALSDGGALIGARNINVATSNGQATLSLTGAGTRASALGLRQGLFVGGNGGQGAVSVGDGASMSFADALGFTAYVGQGGQGRLDITSGGQILINNLGSAAAGQTARLVVGQGSGVNAGSGSVRVTGAGSVLALTGNDTTLFVGRASGGSGSLAVTDGGELRTTLLDVGQQQGSGSLLLDGGHVALSGQLSTTTGTRLGIGLGGQGRASLSNGSVLSLVNPGANGAVLLIGGANTLPGGSGSLAVNASTVTISGPVGAAAVTGDYPGASAVVGYNGSGQASFDAGSQLRGSSGVIVGWKASSSGSLRVAGGSLVQAPYVGIGSSPGVDGGVASLVVNDTSVVNATTIEIGARGTVSGTGTLAGNILNRGVINPGNSPGTLTLQGSFTNQAGGRLVLEIADDGHGGFATDQLIFDPSGSLSLADLAIEFRFLGITDPNAFQASGTFQIDHFLRQGGGAVDHGLLANASYTASSGAYVFSQFSFSADGGAVVAAQAVPEPGSWALLGLGLGLGAWLQRRRQGSGACDDPRRQQRDAAAVGIGQRVGLG